MLFCCLPHGRKCFYYAPVMLVCSSISFHISLSLWLCLFHFQILALSRPRTRVNIYIYIFVVFVVGFGLRSRQCASCTIAGNSRWGHSKIDCSVLDHTGEWIIIMERIIERFAIRHGHLPNETTVFQGFVMSVVQNTLKKMYLNSFGSCLFFLLSLNKIKNSANYRRTAILHWHTNAESHYCCSSVRSGSSPFYFFFSLKNVDSISANETHEYHLFGVQ